VPDTAEIVSAFLYWETISTNVSQNDGAQFRGKDVEVVKKTSQMLIPSISPCWTGGGQGGNTYTMTAYRADVLRDLPRKKDANGIATGRILVNSDELAANGYGPNTVTLPERGSGNVVPQSAGATLLIVYRDLTKPLTSISVFDGLYLQAPGATFTQPFRGVLQSSASHEAKFTLVGGSGANNTSDRLFFQSTQLATDAFTSAASATSDRGWVSPTFNVTSLVPGTDPNDGMGELVTATVDHTKDTPSDCIAIHRGDLRGQREGRGPRRPAGQTRGHAGRHEVA
jgi:hypothetical protein